MSKLLITHVVAGLHASAGGPSRTVVQLTDALARCADLDVTLVTQMLTHDRTVASTACVRRRETASSSRVALKLGLPVRGAMKRLAHEQHPQLIHSHGLWSPAGHWAANAARALGVPLILHPRGMLEPWALAHKAFKKGLALALYQRRDLETARVLIATANAEFESIRRLGLTMPVAVIPNGVELDQILMPDLLAHSAPTRTVLFLSRVHPKKGVLNLFHAWAKVAPQGWRLRIVGPDEGGHLSEVKALAHSLGIAPLVDYVGEVDGVAKSQAYAAADLFVLPTFSENFGVVVAEALVHGLPVITTRGAPWADLETYGCGWWVDIGVDPLVFAMREAMALSDDERQAMGARGQDYVRRFNWGDIARQTIDVYRWVLGQGPQPDCVRTN